MGKVYLGIDPGTKGALAAIYSDGTYSVWDSPYDLVSRGLGKKWKTPNTDSVADLVRSAIVGWEPKAAIEAAHAMSDQGVTGIFNYGKGFGAWLGILAAFSVPRELVPVQKWLKEFFPSKEKHDKARSLRKARELFPLAELELVKHADRAEALLIAEWMRRRA